MRYRHIILILFYMFSINCVARTLSQLELSQAAKSWWSYISAYQSDLEVSKVDQIEEHGEPLIYIFHNRKGGFVILSNESLSRPVLAYDISGSFEYPTTCPAVEDWLSSMCYEIQSIRNGEHHIENAQEQWEAICEQDYRLWQNERSVDQLIHTRWNQSYPYNRLCPTDPQGNGGHAVGGCVAIAMAQVMRYWSYPVQGTGSHSYNHTTYGTQSVNFGQTTYNWDNMPQICDNTNMDIPKLIYHCGVAVNMNYGPSESGGSYLVNDALTNFFGYGFYRQVFRNNYSHSYWVSLMKSELDLNRPILYAGNEDNATVGHAFVLDGYRDDDYFHINWGWGGVYNGYFALSSFLGYNQNNRAIIELQPALMFLPPQNLVVNNQDYIISLNWDPPQNTSCIGYKIYLNGQLIQTINNPNTTAYQAETITQGEYLYQIAAVYSNGQSATITTEKIFVTEHRENVLWHVPIDYSQGWTYGTGWSVYDNGGSEHHVATSSFSGSNVDRFLLSPIFQCPSNAGKLITRMHYVDNPESNASINLEISVFCNNATTVIWTLNASSDWGLFNGSDLELPIEQFAGQNIFIKYRAWGSPISLSGRLYIYDVWLAASYQNDLAITSFNVPDIIGSLNNFMATIEVKNKGTETAGQFSVHLYRQGMQQIATAQGTQLLAGESTILQIPAQIIGSGSVFVHATVNYDDDSYKGNNSAGYMMYVVPSTSVSMPIGNKQSLNIVPDIICSSTSMYQTVIRSSELPFQGNIQSIVLKSRLLDPVTKTWFVYMSNTTNPTLTALQSVDQSQLVFQGVVQVPSGEHPIVLNLTNPFTYTGSHILLTFYSPYEGNISSLWSRFWTYPIAAGLARWQIGDSVNLVNPSSPASGIVQELRPFINFIVSGNVYSTITGRIVNEASQNNGINGALVNFNGPTTHSTTTNTLGNFSITGLRYGSTYSYSIQKLGYQAISGSLFVSGLNVNLNELTMADIIVCPTNVSTTVFDNNCFCQVDWSLGEVLSIQTRENNSKRSKISRLQSGFKIYRLSPGDEEDTSLWNEIASVDPSYRSFIDMQWDVLPVGEYIYAVTTWYNDSQESAPAFSDTVQRFTEGELTGFVRDAEGMPIVNAQLYIGQISGFGPYTAQSDSQGEYHILGIHYYPSYTLLCSHPSYINSELVLGISANQVLQQDFVLNDVLVSPQNLQVAIHDSTYSAHLSWQHGLTRQINQSILSKSSSRAFTGFSLWRVALQDVANEALWTSLGSTTEVSYIDTLWKNLPNNEYIYIVKSTYSSGQSSPCFSNHVEHIYYGQFAGYVKDSSDFYLSGVYLQLNSNLYSYTTVSDSLGCFMFPTVQPGSYNLIASRNEYQDLVLQEVDVIMHEVVYQYLTMTEILWVPENFTAHIEENSSDVYLSWSVPDFDIGKVHLGYKLWRLLPNQESLTSEWINLTPGPIIDTFYIDTSLPNENGSFLYAIKSVFSYDHSSPASFSNIIEYTVNVDDDVIVKPIKMIMRAFPNPTTNNVKITVDLPEEGITTLDVYNLRGQRVINLIDTRMNVGTHCLVWNGCDSAGVPMRSGVYLIRAVFKTNKEIVKVILCK